MEEESIVVPTVIDYSPYFETIIELLMYCLGGIMLSAAALIVALLFIAFGSGTNS